MVEPNPLSPAVMLATSMQAQPGVYAVLLGSGVSTGAGIPTGWGVVKDLVRRVAVADAPEDQGSHAAALADPEAWWAAHHGGDLGYSTLLATLAPTAPVRQGLLAGYFESSEDDQAARPKVPSKAHEALAQLVKRGVVKVIVTTNFDRLTERALEAAGVSPQVIARPEAMAGMAPLAHAVATVIKLHGDYLDLGSRNTPEELESYPEQWRTLLRQVFNEYGLLVSGWSAEWDTGLVAALQAAESRRYPLYWDSRSSRGDTAKQLLALRGGQVIDSASADRLFKGLLASVEALDRLAEPPLTTAIAIARLKRYLPDPVRRLDLHDLVMSVTDRVATAVAQQTVTGTPVSADLLQSVYQDQTMATRPLLDLVVTGVWHDPDGQHDQLWIDVLQRLVDAGTSPLSSGTTGLMEARLLPALLTMSAAGVAAVRRNRDAVLIQLLTQVMGRSRMGTSDTMPAAQLLHVNRVLEDSWVNALPRWGGGSGWYFPGSHLLKEDLRDVFTDLISNDSDYVECFHGMEYRTGLVQQATQNVLGAYKAAPGEFIGERAWSWDDRQVPLAEAAFRSAATTSRRWPWDDFFGGPDKLEQAVASYQELLHYYRQRR